MALAHEPEAISGLPEPDWVPLPDAADFRPWTDDHASLLTVLRALR